jgi:hypothetical protein
MSMIPSYLEWDIDMKERVHKMTFFYKGFRFEKIELEMK